MKPEINDPIAVADLEKQLLNIQIELASFEKEPIYNDCIFKLYNEKTILERNLSLAKNQETAILLDYPYPWDIGAPLPHVISDGFKTFLIYYIRDKNPKWIKSEKKIIDLNTEHDDLTALVQFTRCYSYKFGGVNDEVINGHPLYTHGLEAYEAHEVLNSNWLKQQEKINAVHTNYSHALWENRKHYLFAFHDDLFECIADGYEVAVYRGRIEAVFLEATKKLFKGGNYYEKST